MHITTSYRRLVFAIVDDFITIKNIKDEPLIGSFCFVQSKTKNIEKQTNEIKNRRNLQK